MTRLRLWFFLSSLLFLMPVRSLAQPLPSVPGFVIEEYAQVADPIEVAVDASGVVFTGRDAGGSGGTSSEPVRIHRIEVGGSVSEFGPAITDPDGVVVDLLGQFADPGSVLVCGCTSDGSGGCNGTSGTVTAILPDESAIVVAVDPNLANPNEISTDSPRGLLVNDSGTNGIYRVGGSVVFSPFTRSIAVDATGQIYASELITGTIVIYDSSGALVDASFSNPGSAGYIAFGRGGAFGTDLILTADNGVLFRIDSSGNAISIGTGFSSVTGIAFGPDGSLFISEFANDRVLRVSSNPSVPALGLGGSVLALLALAASGLLALRSTSRTND